MLHTPRSARRCNCLLIIGLAIAFGRVSSAQTTVVPIPWGNSGGGIYGSGANWVGGSIPGSTDTVRFSFDASYSVTNMSGFRVAQTFVNNGTVTFRTQNNTPFFAGRLLLGAVGANAFSSGAELILSGGARVDARALEPANSGAFPVGEGVVIGADTNLPSTFRLSGNGTRFRVVPLSQLGLVPAPTGGAVGTDARFTVGGGSRGTVVVSNGARLETGTSRIGNLSGASGSLVRVTGSGSTWLSSGAIALGLAANNTRLEVQAGARLSSNGLFVGVGGLNAVAVFSNPGTDVNTGQILIGSSGSTGTLSVLDGARLTSTLTGAFTHQLGSLTGDLGQADVTGAGALWQLTGTLEVGNEGTGLLVVQLGGTLTSTSTIDVAASTSSVGSIRVIGENSVLETTGLLRIGPGLDGLGEVKVEGLGEVRANEIRVVRGDLIVENGSVTGGTVNLEGGTTSLASSALLTAPTGMTVGEDADVFLSNSTIDTPTLVNNGRISGTGTLNAGTLVNNGTISPGLSPGRLVITGDFVQTASGTLILEGGSGTPGEESDELVVEGNVTLGGTLDLSLPEDFVPVEGTTLTFVRSTNPDATLSGGFSQVTNVSLSEGLALETGFSEGVVEFEILPKPTSDNVLDGTRSGQVALSASETISTPVVLGGTSGRTGELTVSGDGTEIDVEGIVTVGGEGGGALILSEAAQLSSTGALNIGRAGRLVLDGGGVAAPSLTNFGVVSGQGTIAAGTFTNSGQISPGTSPGILQVEGNLVHDRVSQTTFELGGPERGTDYDAISVAGDVALDGTFTVVLINDFNLSDSQSFDLLAWTGTLQLSEDFELIMPPPSDGKILTLAIGEKSLSVVAGPAPVEIGEAVVEPPAAPVPQLPSVSSFDSFILEWPAVLGAISYQLDVATDPGFTDFVQGYENLDVGPVTTTEATGLPLGTYYYRVRAANAAGSSAPSETIAVQVGGRLVNLSTRGQTSAASPLIAGFVVTGAEKTLLIRAAGPVLATDPFNVPGALANPRLRVVDQSTRQDIAVNEAWDDSDPLLAQATLASGAGLQFNPGSLDAAVALTLAPGVYTAVVESVDGESGVVLAEVYEVDTQGRLANISTRGQTFASGSRIMIPGTIFQPSDKRLLIRVVGETLASFPGVPSVLIDPILELYDNSNPGTPLMVNDDWETNANADEIAAASTAGSPLETGAFPLLSGSRDAALLVSLPVNSAGYTIHARGKDGESGTVLVEIYEVP